MKNIFLILVLFQIPSTFAAVTSDSIYNFQIKTLIGDPVALKKYKGSVLLIVNTASHCGYTPQYEGLQVLYQKYKKSGFEILAFPSNDFGAQEPGTSKEIKNFCETKYKVSFPLFEKNSVSGTSIQPLFDWLIRHEPEAGKNASEVKWNFEKFLISRDGKVLARFRSSVKPEDESVTRAIETALKK